MRVTLLQERAGAIRALAPALALASSEARRLKAQRERVVVSARASSAATQVAQEVSESARDPTFRSLLEPRAGSRPHTVEVREGPF